MYDLGLKLRLAVLSTLGGFVPPQLFMLRSRAYKS